jgi:glutathione synthase/RimK-type ligase-like ATP-grasp enzyme
VLPTLEGPQPGLEALRSLEDRGVLVLNRAGALFAAHDKLYDLRILVAAGEIVGAVKRVAAPGDWRTNIALGGSRMAAVPPPHACLIALGAAAALGADFVGVDLLPSADGGWVVLELNGAVDFTPEYSLSGESVFERVVQALVRSAFGDTGVSLGHISKVAGGPRRATAIASAGAAEEAS